MHEAAALAASLSKKSDTTVLASESLAFRFFCDAFDIHNTCDVMAAMADENANFGSF